MLFGVHAGIHAAAAAAAADLAAAILSAPASQCALAAVAAGTAAIAAADGSIRVKVPGVAGPVELVSAAAAADAAVTGGKDGQRSGQGGVSHRTGTEGWQEGDAEGAGGEWEEVLPDLGMGEDGQPLSRSLRQREGLASWGAGAWEGVKQGTSSGGGIHLLPFRTDEV
jgi:hypothetical protein